MRGASDRRSSPHLRRALVCFLVGAALAWIERPVLLAWIAQPFLGSIELPCRALGWDPSPRPLGASWGANLAISAGLLMSISALRPLLWEAVVPERTPRGGRLALPRLVSLPALALVACAARFGILPAALERVVRSPTVCPPLGIADSVGMVVAYFQSACLGVLAAALVVELVLLPLAWCGSRRPSSA